VADFPDVATIRAANHLVHDAIPTPTPAHSRRVPGRFRELARLRQSASPRCGHWQLRPRGSRVVVGRRGRHLGGGARPAADLRGRADAGQPRWRRTHSL